MKVYITTDSAVQFQDYMTLSPCQSFRDIKLCQMNALTMVCDGEADEIILDHALCYVEIDKIEEVVAHIAKKLSHNGVLIICDYDVNEITRKFSEYNLSLYEFNVLLHGNVYTKKSSFARNTIEELMKRCGLKIMKRRYNDNEFVLEGLRT